MAIKVCGVFRSHIRPTTDARCPAAGQLPVEMKTLVGLNDPAYGMERSYNGLRLAHSLAKREGEEVRVFLLADAVGCAVAGQGTPDGYYNLERMVAAAIHRGVQVGLCGTCMDARAIHEEQLVDGARRSNLEDLTDWLLWADKVVAF